MDLDWYSGRPPYRITPLDGIRSLVGRNATVNYVQYDADAADAVDTARKSDVAVVFVGNHPTCDAGWNRCYDPGQGKEGIDRKSLDFDPDQENLIRHVAAANRRTIVVLVASFPYAIDQEKAHIPALLHLAHNSQEEGTAIAEALFGKINPAGRLVATWPASIDQLPPIMDYNIRDGRTYIYFKGEPLFPFGYGLSYSSFSYSNVKTTADHFSERDSITISAEVSNTSSRDGDEVVQLYVRHEESKLPLPEQELKAFRRVSIPAGQTRTVEFPLKADDLRYWDQGRHAWSLEKDRVEVRIGASSADIKLKTLVAVD